MTIAIDKMLLDVVAWLVARGGWSVNEPCGAVSGGSTSQPEWQSSFISSVMMMCREALRRSWQLLPWIACLLHSGWLRMVLTHTPWTR